MSEAGVAPGPLARRVDRGLGRVLRLPAARNSYRVERGVRTPTRDGFDLVGDHYLPDTGSPRGTILVRTPYGRDFPWSLVYARPFAARGYHVLVQSVRGTFGSGDEFQPMVREADDGQDTVAWLREQPWFDGRLATLGLSYLGFVQWALLRDPPPELRACVVLVGPHDFAKSTYGTGAFTLRDFLGWSDMMATIDQPGRLARLRQRVDGGKRLRPGLDGLPLPDAAEPVLNGRAPWYRDWASRPDRSDPFWEPMNQTAALSEVNVPVKLIGGWRDLFLRQTCEQYTVLRDRDVPVSLTMGPWTHTEVMTKGASVMVGEALSWLDEHVAGDAPAGHAPPVRIAVTGTREWHDLPAWPPPSHELRYITRPPTPDRHHQAGRGGMLVPPPGDRAGGSAGDSAGDRAAGTSVFRYDPADPTPSVGGRVLDGGNAGVKDNRELEARPDVLTFTSPPLTEGIDVIGTPVLELVLSLDNPHADVFARLCEVDGQGRSYNVSDVLRRLDPAVPAGEVQRLRLELDPCAHRVPPGHRLRLQLSGGAHPRYARNPGTGEPPATAAALVPSTHTVHHDGTVLVLPAAGR